MNSSLSVTYYANVGKSTKVNGIRVSMFGWDFGSANYQKRLGHFTIPAEYSTEVPIGQSKKITMNHLPVTAKVDTLQRYAINGKVYIRLGLGLTNGGTKVLSDPGYKAYLKSVSGSVFELISDSASTGLQASASGERRYLLLDGDPFHDADEWNDATAGSGRRSVKDSCSGAIVQASRSIHGGRRG